MPGWQGKSKGTPLGYRIMVFVCTRFGLMPAYAVLRFVALYFFLFSWDSSRYIYSYFHDRLRFGALRSRLLVFSNFYIFAQTLVDKTVFMAGIENRFTFDFNGEENLRAMVDGGKGGILLSAHVGNWEVAGNLLKRIHTRVNVVMYDGEHKNIKAYLESVTGERNLKVIVIRENLSHVYEIGEALQKNELVCLHSDRFLEGNKTVLKDFLNGKARFPDGPFTLAATFNVPVSIVFALKDKALHYHFYASPVQQRKAEESKTEYKEGLINYFVRQLEEKIALYPTQWFNYYNFWE